MWFIQTPVDALALPSDELGRTTLTGKCLAWYHLVNDHAFSEHERSAIAEMPVQWSMSAWQEVGRRVQLPDAIVAHEELGEMVRAEPYRACVLARYPQPGKRQSDKTLELIVVVPPEQFTRYEELVRFAMMLPAGHVSMTLASPVVPPPVLATTDLPRLITPGTRSLMEGMEIVVARGEATKKSAADLRPERRRAPVSQDAAHLLEEAGDDWLLFAAQSAAEVANGTEQTLE